MTHWSSRLLGAELGLSHVTVVKVWKKWNLQPWRSETFKFSADPDLEAKVRDVVGRYLKSAGQGVSAYDLTCCSAYDLMCRSVLGES